MSLFRGMGAHLFLCCVVFCHYQFRAGSLDQLELIPDHIYTITEFIVASAHGAGQLIVERLVGRRTVCWFIVFLEIFALMEVIAFCLTLQLKIKVSFLKLKLIGNTNML